MKHLEEVDRLGNGGCFKGIASPAFLPEIRHVNTYSPSGKSRQESTMYSDSSTVTTSTARRQSVRDLFDQYGLNRPDGLVPEDSISLISPKGEPSTAESVRKAFSSPQSVEEKNQPRKTLKKLNTPSIPSRSDLGENRDVQPREVKRLSSQVLKLSSSKRESYPTNLQPRKTTIAELPIAHALPKGSRIAKLVRNSPFLIADHLLSGRSSRCFPLMIGDGAYRPESASGGAKSTTSHHSSLNCQATHKDHEPYRHSVPCSLREKSAPEESSDASTGKDRLVDDSARITNMRPHKDKPQASKHSSYHTIESRNEGSQLPNQLSDCISHYTQGSDYVECRGYPRTGHARHGSATSGALGQCQHCIDDCQCTSCRSTHHSVRCCINEEHQGMVHQHHHSRTFQYLNEHLDCPTFSLGNTNPRSNVPTLEEEPDILPRSTSRTFLEGEVKSPTPPSWIAKSMSKPPNLTQYSTLASDRTAVDTVLSIEAIQNSAAPCKGRQKQSSPPFMVDFSSLEQNREAMGNPWVGGRSNPWDEHETKRSYKGPIHDQDRLLERRSLSQRIPSKASRANTTASGQPPRSVSEFLRLGEANAVPLLNQNLLRNQEKLKRIEKQCDDRLHALAQDHEPSSQNFRHKAPTRKGENVRTMEKQVSTVGSKEAQTAQKQIGWGYSLVDTQSKPSCCTDVPALVAEHGLSEDELVPPSNDPLLQEHFLHDDPIIDKSANKKPTHVTKTSVDGICIREGTLTITEALVDSLIKPSRKVEEHDFVWETKLLAHQNEKGGDCGKSIEVDFMPIRRLTIILHIDGQGDLVIEADLQKGSQSVAKQ